MEKENGRGEEGAPPCIGRGEKEASRCDGRGEAEAPLVSQAQHSTAHAYRSTPNAIHVGRASFNNSSCQTQRGHAKGKNGCAVNQTSRLRQVGRIYRRCIDIKTVNYFASSTTNIHQTSSTKPPSLPATGQPARCQASARTHVLSMGRSLPAQIDRASHATRPCVLLISQ